MAPISPLLVLALLLVVVVYLLLLDFVKVRIFRHLHP